MRESRVVVLVGRHLCPLCSLSLAASLSPTHTCQCAYIRAHPTRWLQLGVEGGGESGSVGHCLSLGLETYSAQTWLVVQFPGAPYMEVTLPGIVGPPLTTSSAVTTRVLPSCRLT